MATFFKAVPLVEICVETRCLTRERRERHSEVVSGLISELEDQSILYTLRAMSLETQTDQVFILQVSPEHEAIAIAILGRLGAAKKETQGKSTRILAA